MTEFQESELAKVRVMLADRQIALKDRLGKVEVNLASTHSKGFADQATEREQDEVLQVEERVLQLEMNQVEAAIARIDNGTYGTCINCGQLIVEGRLAAQPEAPFCMKCAS